MMFGSSNSRGLELSLAPVQDVVAVDQQQETVDVAWIALTGHPEGARPVHTLFTLHRQVMEAMEAAVFRDDRVDRPVACMQPQARQ